MKTTKIIFYTSTSLLTAMMLMSVVMYVLKYDDVSLTFVKLGYPVYIIYPLALVKLLGLIAIWTNKSKTLKEWAYAGFFFDFVLAFFAHFMIGDGEFIPAIVALVLLLTSYIMEKKVRLET